MDSWTEKALVGLMREKLASQLQSTAMGVEDVAPIQANFCARHRVGLSGQTGAREKPGSGGAAIALCSVPSMRAAGFPDKGAQVARPQVRAIGSVRPRLRTVCPVFDPESSPYLYERGSRSGERRLARNETP